MSQAAQPCILIVEDDPQFVAVLQAGLQGPWRLQIETTVQGAMDWIVRGESFSAAIVDLNLPDGSGLDVVARIREQAALRPVILMTGDISATIVNKVWALRAEYLVKGDVAGTLAVIRQRFLDVAGSRRQEISSYVERWANKKGLTPREAEVLTLAVLDSDRDEIAELLGISSETLKVHIKNILLKGGHARFDDLARRLRISARTRISGAMTKL